MAVYNDYGVFYSVAKWYMHWQARFSAHLLNNFILKSYELTGTLFHFTLLLYVGFAIAFYRLSKFLLPLWKDEKWLLFNSSALVFHIFLFFSFDFSTFYWVNVASMYLGGLMAALFLATEILSEKKTAVSWLIIFFASVYAGSSAENFAIIFFFLLGITTFYFFMKNDIRFSKAAFALFVFGAAMSLMLFAPGTVARGSLFPANNIFGTVLISLKTVFLLVRSVFDEKWIYLLFLIVLAFLVGRFYPFNKINKINFVKITISFLFFLWLCTLPIGYAMGESGPLRAHTQIAFYIILFSAYFFFRLGRTFPIMDKKNIDFIIAISVLFIFLLFSKFGFDIPAAMKYSQTEDKKIDLLLEGKSKNRKELLVLSTQKAPDHLVFKSNTLSNDTSFFVNKCICRYLKLGFPLSEK